MKLRISIVLATMGIVCWSSCSKTNDTLDERQLLQGQWKGVSRISKYTFYNFATGTEEYWRDTSRTNDRDTYFKINIQKDSIITEASRLHNNWGSFILKMPHYIVNNKTLSYVSNPFTTLPVMSFELNSSEILLLTKNQLILHDIDTLSLSPIQVREVWFNFVR